VRPPPERARFSGFDVVAAIMAVGLVMAVVFITIGVLADAILSEGPGLSDNATQVLTATLGGIIGVLGSYVGFRVSAQQSDQAATNLTATNAAASSSAAPPDPGADA
jgi:hypothetical protein